MESQRETGVQRARPANTTGKSQPMRTLATMPQTPRTLATPRVTVPDADDLTLILPARPPATSRLPAVVPPARSKSAARWFRPATFLAVAVSLVAVLGVSVLNAQQSHPISHATTPPPSGHGPWTAAAGSVNVVLVPPPPAGAPGAARTGNTSPSASTATVGALEPCHDSVQFLPTITEWSVPPGCYAQIYQPNPANYVQRPGFGWCNWWVRVNHPDYPDITENTSYPRVSTPAPGDPVFFDGNEQGADSEGHWAQVVAVAPDNYWVLISEMNFAWRGAGWAKIDYRYIHVSPGVHFVTIAS